MDEVIRESLAPVLHDLAVAGLAAPRVEDAAWTGQRELSAVMLWSSDGSGRGASVSRSASAAERIASVADQVQEWVIEELWSRAPTNWPRCPQHPGTHPLTAKARADAAVWVCPADATLVAVVGAL